MNNRILKILIILSTVLLYSCAKVYNPINPQDLEYVLHSNVDNVKLSYKYDVLREKGNKRMAKKESKYNLKIIAVEIKNNSDSAITIGKDVQFVADNVFVFPMEPIDIKYYLNQPTAAYLPGLLASILYLKILYNDYVNIFPIGALISVPYVIDNMLTSNKANKKFAKELELNNVIKTEILPGQTIYGLIGVRNADYYTLSLKKNHH